MVKVWISIAALSVGVALATTARASDVGYLYGRVTTVDGDHYEGELRWGDEEAFWHNIFNATKIGNDNLEYVDDRDLDRMRRRHRHVWGLFSVRSWDDGDFTHVFAARFGDLRRIEVRGRGRVEVEFRGGEKARLSGGSNDVGATVTVLDPKLGRHAIRWNRIRAVEFRDTPEKLARKLGDPLYGTVRTGRLEFTGPIQWDNDECLSIDTLDGETRDGRVSIPFGDIRSIRKHRAGALVTLASGDELYMTGTNDVNHENRGIVVTVKGIGSVKVGWDDFEEVAFQPEPESGSSYADYGTGGRLAGEVEAGADRYRGNIVYDLDETWDFELLQGKIGDTEYLIPFRQIARIVPKDAFRTEVELRSGVMLELEDGQDVSRKNEGLLVSTDRAWPEYIDWRRVDAIRFR